MLRLAKVDAVARESTKLLLPRGNLSLGVVVRVSKLVYSKSWLEIVERNENALGKLGWTVRSGLRSSVLPEIPWGLSDD